MSGPTRGSGLLESFLSKKRTRRAKALISLQPKHSVLDIGCGSEPLFLSSIEAFTRVGVERFPPSRHDDSLDIVIADASAPHLPFGDSTFNTVTMLAVLEHLPAAVAPRLLTDIHRVLKPAGTFVLTTPPPRTDHLLKIFAKLRLVSPEEIDEHDHVYTTRDLRALIAGSPFRSDDTTLGTFELGMNTWVRAIKSEASQ